MDKFNPWMRFLHHIYDRVHRKEWHFLGCTTGKMRSGKSLFTAFNCALLYKHFNIENDIVYKEQEFSSRFKELSQYGEAIIWDEAGVGMPAREWYKIQNRELGKRLQTIGHLRPIIFFVTPDITFIDTQPRKMFDYFFEVTGRTDNYSKIKPFRLDVNKRTGKIYYRYPRMVDQNGLHRMRMIKFHLPPKEFIDQYKGHSEPAKMGLREASLETQHRGKTKKMDMENLLKHIKETVSTQSQDFEIKPNRIDLDLVRYRFRKDLDFIIPGERERILKEIVKVCQWEKSKDKTEKPIAVKGE